jgi:hypothetical protein
VIPTATAGCCRQSRRAFPVASGIERSITDGIPALAALLHETAEHHDPYEKSHAEHHWWDWYAAYMDARQRGESSEQASASAGR